MKQKKIGTTLYVFDTTAYQITEDTDAAVIKIQLECIPAFEVLNESLKDKFEPINYKLFCVKHPEWADYLDDYTVSVSVTGNGAVSASPTSADEGEEITLTVTPESGYEINTLTAASGGTAITITDNKFTMPAGNVTVTATFQGQEFDITCAEATHGSVSAPSTARLGDTVTITTTPDTNYELDTLTVMCGDVPVTVDNNTFTMPAGDVTITATFVLQSFSITCEPATNGTVSAPASAQVGSTVTITTTPAAGYTLQSISAVDSGSSPVVITNNQFTMPASDVHIYAYFVQDVPFEQQYFTIESEEDNNEIYISTGHVFSISTDNGTTWTNAVPGSGIEYTISRTLDVGEKILVKSNTGAFAIWVDPESVVSPLIDADYGFKIYGNSMSLIYGDNFVNQTSFPADSTSNLLGLLMKSKVTDASNLILPATTVPVEAYEYMFYNCSSLTANGAPMLPASNVALQAYDYMFDSTNIDELIVLMQNYGAGSDVPINMLPTVSQGTVYVNPNLNHEVRMSFTNSGWTVVNYAG